jgi:pectinesterase
VRIQLIFFSLLFALAGLSLGLRAGEMADIIVAVRGGGDFRSIQEALDAVPHRHGKPVVILIRNGLYREQISIRQSGITLVGENRDSTRIVAAVLREEWNQTHGGSDWGSGVVNIDTGTTDITLANLTILNNHGALYGTYRKHQFTVRGAGTRIMILGCNIISDGGDALSLWNRESGMYYHSDCYFEGWVDYVCPRGWCYITESRFFGHNRPSASIWHDGSHDKSQKFVITDSFFDGVADFPLGRNHLDAQIYLIRCRFSANMADRPFYRPPSSPREWQWGARHYFHDSHRTGGDYAWLKDNVRSAEGSPDPDKIDARWTFDGRWDPEAAMPSVLPYAILPSPRDGARLPGASDVSLSWIAGRNAESHIVYFGIENPPPRVARVAVTRFNPGVFAPDTTYYWRVDEVNEGEEVPGRVWKFRTGASPARTK